MLLSLNLIGLDVKINVLPEMKSAVYYHLIHVGAGDADRVYLEIWHYMGAVIIIRYVFL